MTELLHDNQLRAEIGNLMAQTVRLADVQAKSNIGETTWLPIVAVVATAGFGATLALVLPPMGHG